SADSRLSDSHRPTVAWEPLGNQAYPPGRNQVPKLRDGKGSHGRARREAATRAAPDAGWRPGPTPDPRDLWDPVADDRHPAEPIRHRDDGRDPQRRPRWGPVGLLRDYAEEPDEWRHRGGRDQHHPDLFRRSARPDRRHRRDPRRNPRGGEALSPLVPTRLGRHFRPGTPKLRQRSSSPFSDLYSSPGPSHENRPTTSSRLGPVTSLGCVEPCQLRRCSAYSGG